LIPILIVGIYRAFSRNGNDFSVFYQAWQLVVQGRGTEIYAVSPDRFLYCPGFAWLFAFLGAIPRNYSLALWCLAKVAIIFFIIIKLSKQFLQKDSFLAYGLSVWGVILIARPLLIDFEYGQVNLIILGVCLWALLGRFESGSSIWAGLRWAGLSFAAVAKLFPIPLLIIPWVMTSNISTKKLRIEKLGILLGAFIALALPVASVGFQGSLNLLNSWKNAVLARGLPLESHNQSFPALLYHFLSGSPTHVLSVGSAPVLLGYQVLSEQTIQFLTLFWFCFTFGILLGWIVSGASRISSATSTLVWAAITIALIIIPSHLVWKPYFVISMPLAILLLHFVFAKQRSKIEYLLLIFFALMINFTGFDFVGKTWGMYLESASLFLLIHLLLIFSTYYYSRQDDATS